MNRYDILEAMSGIRDEYIEEAAVFEEQTGRDKDRTEVLSGPGRGNGRRRLQLLRLQKWAAAAAALLCVCVIALAIQSGRRLQTASEFDSAEPGMVSMSEEKVEVEEEEGLETPSDAGSFAYDDRQAAGGIDTTGKESPVIRDESREAAGAFTEEETEADVSAASAMSEAGVSGTVRQMTEKEIRVFENSLAEETGYSSLRFTHEVTTDSDDWFSLRMKAYTCAADGFEQVTHFNISRDTAEYVTLDTLFSEDTDYITPLSKEVIRQMREQMASNPDVEYWLDSVEGSEYDFQEISPAQDFYFDSEGNLVLCFNEGEAAPLYMGTVEFTIPRDVTEKLLKRSI